MEIMHTAHIPAGPGPHPTVLALHGWGANSHDLLGLARILHQAKHCFCAHRGQSKCRSARRACWT